MSGVALILWLSALSAGGLETDSCSCKSGVSCFYDASCPGLGCGAEGKPNCRYCGHAGYPDCPAKVEVKSKPEKEDDKVDIKKTREKKPGKKPKKEDKDKGAKDTQKLQKKEKSDKSKEDKKSEKATAAPEKDRKKQEKVEKQKPAEKERVAESADANKLGKATEKTEEKGTKPEKNEKHGDKSSAKSSCPCLHSKTLRCFYDESCPGLGCGAHGVANCRFCGDKNGTYKECPDATPSAKTEEAAEKSVMNTSEACPCLHSETLRCFYDTSCPGLGCGAHGYKNCRFCGDKDAQYMECPDKHIVETRSPGSVILFPSEKQKAEQQAAMDKAHVRLTRDEACPCEGSSTTPCFYDETCPGLGCGAQGFKNCRFCGDKEGQFPSCPDSKEKPGSPKPAKSEEKPPKSPEAKAKPATLEVASVGSPCASCLHSKTLPCFYDESCPGVGCGAHGHTNCRFCGDKDGQFQACPDPDAKPSMAVSSAHGTAPVAVPAASPTGDPAMTDEVLKTAMSLDVYRSMAGSAVDTHFMADDDIADLTGAIKYVHTEILTEHLQSPIRQTRKYGIDVVTRHRMQFKNPSTVLKTLNALQGEFSQFVTYDFGQATNPAQLPLIKEQGDFVGIAPCTDLKCDVRFPSPKPYAWLSLGNWCPNLSWDKKGTQSDPNPKCLKRGDGTFIKGGLCENGFNRDSFLPGPDPPSGEQGCVYKYGKATLVKLDDVVGITNEYCGKRRCKDWLDFRFNCSNGQHYQRQFMPSGEIKSVEYCVEFDIHPACEANCEAAACKEVLRSGKPAYLGLPFWHGRCDPRANDRRVEAVGFALGLPGAMSSHLLVDPKLLERPCPASKASSWSCVPMAALRFAGPYCTRRFNGACDRCHIPGVLSGPEEVQRPWCPVDILESVTYKDLGLKIECKSTSASHHCCLYTGTCHGSSDPSSASLTDDGLALVAARKSTEDMKQFLQRAARADNRYSSLPLEHASMHWAAYFAWDPAPLERTLDEALAEMRMYLTSEQTMVTLYTTTTTSAAAVVSGPSGKLPPSLSCAARSVSFAPLDMPGTMAMPTASLAECQQKCAKTKGCFHFSMLEVGNSCHLQSFSALAQENILGFISGPPECWQAKKDKGLLIDKGHDTYVSLRFACMAWGSSFSPALPGALSTLEEKDFQSEMEATLECQKRCIDREDCEHFTVSFPIRSCVLVGKDALVTEGIQGAISGPPKCDDKSIQSYYWEALPKSEQPRWRASSAVSALVLGMVTIAALALSFALYKRPACSARSVEHVCCGQEDDEWHHVSPLLEWHQAAGGTELWEDESWDLEFASGEVEPLETLE